MSEINLEEELLKAVREGKITFKKENGSFSSTADIIDIKQAPGHERSSGKIVDIQVLCQFIVNKCNIIFDRGELYFYLNGIYLPKGDVFIEKKLQSILGANFTNRKAREVINYIEIMLKDVDGLGTNKLESSKKFINVNNGLLDWEREEPVLTRHTPKFFSSIRIPVKYDPAAKCPAIETFFSEVLPKDCMDLIYELFGLILIPYTNFEKAFILVGSGANGKSTILKLLQVFIGHSNYSSESLHSLSENRFRPAELSGKLVNIFPDLPDRFLKDSSFFKNLVSGDVISVERKNEKAFKFENIARLIFSANSIPPSSDKTSAYYRRLVIIRFPNEFMDKNADKSLLSRMTQPEELSGLLNKATKALVRLFKNNEFSIPDSVKEELNKYETDNDSVKLFIDENCVVDPSNKVEKNYHEKYKKWCADANLRALSKGKFNERVKNVPSINEARVSKENRTRIWKGVDFNDEY